MKLCNSNSSLSPSVCAVVLSLLVVGVASGQDRQALQPKLKSSIGVSARPTFAAPVRMKAGDEFLGAGRLYPSPVFHDVDGDGHLDIVIGDLPGRVTYAPRLPGRTATYGAERRMEDRDGKPLDFGNW